MGAWSAVLFSFILAAVLVTPVAAESDDGPPPSDADTGRYVVVMEEEPLVTAFGQDDVDSAAAEAKAEELTESHEDAAASVGIGADAIGYSYTVALNGFSVTLTDSQRDAIKATDGVLMVLEDKMRFTQTDSSPGFLGLDKGREAHPSGVRGEGVVIGVIDDGIWPEHPSVADDGSYPDPGITLVDTPELPACDFGNTAHNPDDAPFTCNNKLIGARQMLSTYRSIIGAAPDEFDSARDDNGHGTHTATTAGGNAKVRPTVLGTKYKRISGIAPRAHIIAYKGLGNLGGFTSDLAAAIDQAVADGVDVINYSVGGGAGSPGADDIAFLFAADAGVHVATSAGNSGPGPATIGGPAHMPWLTTVGASTQSRFFQGRIRAGSGRSYVGASITGGTRREALVDAELAGGDLCVPGTLDPAVVAGNIVLCRRGAIARAAKSLAVFQAGGAGMILYNNDDVDNLLTDTHWVPSVHVDNTPGLAIKRYIATSSNPTARITTGELKKWKNAPTMAVFSSRGPVPVASAADIIKPDVTAPGVQIMAGWSPFPDPDSTPPGELFAAIQGTSMSSPHVAGHMALIDQVHPDWSAAAVKSAIMTTAYQKVRDNDRRSPATPFEMGAGHIDPGQPRKRGSSFQPGLVYEAGFLDYLGYLCDAFPEVFTNPAATCASLDGLGVPTKAYDLNYPSIGVAELAGSQTITRTVTSVANGSGPDTYKVSVDRPEGYEVTVTPDEFHVEPGQQVTYQVTITNVSAPIGEWRHGSLTWKSRAYEVRSPISVKGAKFAASGAITGGAGVDGNASFPISFGYTGAYTASNHGLEPATVFSDDVLQDPDQSFDPADVAAGGANLHEITASGDAALLIEMPPDATEPDADLDLFLFGPAGELVASSTSGGTDESIIVPLLDDGTYQLYVHGWSTPGGDSDYDLYTWLISATPGGNLSVDSAPASAVTGQQGTIAVSWAGPTAGQWHIGAVSHSDASGLLGLTLVDVDNRALSP